MKHLLVLCFLFSLCSCGPSNHARKENAITRDSAKTPVANIAKAVPPEEPNVLFLRKRLFTYFERHKDENVFDTTDDTYAAYWGPIFYSPYFVKAGHLFNNRQYHAIVFYTDDSGSGMMVYLKKGGRWQQLAADTSRDGSGLQGPDLYDWNNDGVKDLSTKLGGGPGDKIELYDVWLMDRMGDKLYHVDGFPDIRNPERDGASGHVLSYATCGCADNCMVLGEYAFKDYKLSQLYELGVSCCMDTRNADSACRITYSQPEKQDKVVYTSMPNVYKAVPKAWKKRMRQKY